MTDFRGGYFSIHTESAGELKAFAATSRQGVHVLKLEVVFGSAVEMGYALDDLTRLAAAIKAAKTTAKKRTGKLLALPAPGGDQ